MSAVVLAFLWAVRFSTAPSRLQLTICYWKAALSCFSLVEVLTYLVLPLRYLVVSLATRSSTPPGHPRLVILPYVTTPYTCLSSLSVRFPSASFNIFRTPGRNIFICPHISVNGHTISIALQNYTCKLKMKRKWLCSFNCVINCMDHNCFES